MCKESVSGQVKTLNWSLLQARVRDVSALGSRDPASFTEAVGAVIVTFTPSSEVPDVDHWLVTGSWNEVDEKVTPAMAISKD